MIVPDVNLLLYATDTGSPRHRRARDWWSARLAGHEAVGLAWTTKLAFLRLVTNPRVFARPLPARAAIEAVAAWEACRPVVTLEPTARHLAVLGGLLDEVGTAGNLVPDCHLAALALEHGATLCSADHDFGRFRGLRWEDPLAA